MCVHSSTELRCTAPKIENGEALDNTKEYKRNEILDYTCNTRYKPSQGRPSRCSKAGLRAEWIPTPLCERKYLHKANTPQHVLYLSPAVARFLYFWLQNTNSIYTNSALFDFECAYQHTKECTSDGHDYSDTRVG